MNTEKLKEIVEKSDMLKLQKNVTIGFISRAEQYENRKAEDRLLIEQVANEKKLSEILYSSDSVKIYSIFGKEDWDIKFPIRSIFVNKKGVWERSCTVSPSFEIAFLVYMEKKHLGNNSQFVDFALKMLEIKIDE
jgi:hypothetical protein